MANFYIITNNPLAGQKYPGLARMQAGTVGDVFTTARNAVHKGAVLISHPLSGSVKPNESPYKSIVISLERPNSLCTDSLQLIEGAIAVLHKLGTKQRQYPPATLEDFAVIDLDLLDSAMQALPAEYHA